MPSYADLGGYGPEAASPINAAYYTDGSGGSPYKASTPSPPGASKASWNRTRADMEPMVTKLSFDDIPMSSSAKYHSLANRETTVRLSALPAKLQPMFVSFDVRGDGLLDTAELGKAAELYRRHQAAKKYRWLRVMLYAIIFLCIGYLTLGCFKSHRPCAAVDGGLPGPQQVTLDRFAPSHEALINETTVDMLKSATNTESLRP